MRDGEKKYHKNSHKKQTNKGIYIKKKKQIVHDVANVDNDVANVWSDRKLFNLCGIY